MECPVCEEEFDFSNRRPKVLPCGHTFCLRCLQQLQTKTCPLDKRDFLVPPETLTDNYILLQECANPDTSTLHRSLGCLTCNKNATAECVDDEHALCSLKKLRAEDARRLQDAIDRGTVTLNSLSDSIQAAGRDLNELYPRTSSSRLDQERANLAKVKERLLKAQGASTTVWEEAKRQAAALTAGLPRIATQLMADLADPSVLCDVTVRRGPDGVAAWRGEVRPVEDAAARVLLYQLACSRRLQQSQQPDGEMQQLPPTPLWQERSNDAENELTVEQMAAIIDVGSRVRRGRDWDPSWTWDGTPPGPGTVISKISDGTVDVKWDRNVVSKPLFYYLCRNGNYTLRLVTELSELVCEAPIGEDFLNVKNIMSKSNNYSGMSKLLGSGKLAKVRSLVGLTCHRFPAWSQMVLEQVAPRLEAMQMESPLPRHLDVVLAMPHLQALSITGVTGEQLQLVSQMASLRRLELHCTLDAPLPVLTFPAAAAGAGLRWLRCGVRPLVTALSLARAHADSLEELQLVAASVQPYGCPDLAHEIQGCGLKKLSKLVLLRQTAYTTFCRHDKESCQEQIRQLWDAFMEQRVIATVMCSFCDPKFDDDSSD